MRTLITFKNPNFYLIVFLSFILSLESCIRRKTYIKPNDSIFYLNKESSITTDSLKLIYAEDLKISPSTVSIKTCICDSRLIKVTAPGAASLLFGGAQIQTRPTGGAGGGGLPSIFANVAANIKNYEPNIVIEAPEINRVNNSLGSPNSGSSTTGGIKYEPFVNSDSISLSYNSSLPTTTIAILDSGLPQKILNKGFIWKNNVGNNGWNFIDNNNDLTEKLNPHSNNIVAFLTNELSKRGINANLMILKVLDKNNQGDYFDILCGILYAYQNNASILNLSLGYYGQRSDFLKKFLEAKNFYNPNISDTTHFQNKWIITAAGNLDTQADFLEKTFHKRNLSTRKNTFYPAYFAKDLNNVFAITSIESLENVASNQNYSSEIVDFGVKTDDGVNFRINGDPFTGSSYAAPIFTGLVADYYKSNISDTTKTGNFLRHSDIKIGVGLKRQIIKGKYITKKGATP